MREITFDEVDKLKDCIIALSEYHNEVSTNFKGIYPSRPYSETLELFSNAIRNNVSHIAVIEDNVKIIGFCKIDTTDKKGKLDYLVVLKEYRKKGYGKQLMDWAMDMFRKFNVEQIEVKVIDGNDTVHLYEKYGFKMNAHILMYKN